MFAYAAAGVPTTVRCDPGGNVYASCGDGIEVWSPGGKPLGLIEIPGASFSYVVPLTPPCGTPQSPFPPGPPVRFLFHDSSLQPT